MPADRARRGLLLQGGGALGAWQAGALARLDAAGLSFDSVMGWSIGAVNGAAYALGLLPRALDAWRRIGPSALWPAPRLSPLSLFSPRRLRDFFAGVDDESARRALRAELTIVSASPADAAPLNACYTPAGRAGWDGPFLSHLDASCAIPLVFPPVALDYRGRRVSLVDGGVPMDSPLDLSPLAGCSELLVLEMVRADELGRSAWLPWTVFEQRSREAGRRLVDEGLASLPPSVRVSRLAPSARLPGFMLDFRAGRSRALLARGAADAEAYLRTAR